MGKGKRKRERAERREGKGRLVDLNQARKAREERKAIAAAAIENGKRARTALEERPEYKAHMAAWHAAGCPPGHGDL